MAAPSPILTGFGVSPIFVGMVRHIPKTFAPLNSQKPGVPHSRKLQGIVFDVDGTLCEPQNWMFSQMRAVLGIPKTVDILEHIYALPAVQQDAAMEAVRAVERDGMSKQVPQPGLVELMSYLDMRGVRKGICTRNFDAPVEHLLRKYLAGTVFAPVVTRAFRPPKPDPAGILFIARAWGLMRPSGDKDADTPTQDHLDDESETKSQRPGSDQIGRSEPIAEASDLIMVGDSIDDMTAGRRAGAKTVLLVNDVNRHLVEHEHTDLVISRLDDLIQVLEDGQL